MRLDYDPDELDFATGEDLITGLCAPCKQGRHLDCRSLGGSEDAETVWPFFPPEPGEPTPEPTTATPWVCGCLAVARLKRDPGKHGEDRDT